MGRDRKEVDPEVLYDMLERGFEKKEIAEVLGVSVPTLSNRIADITEKQGLLLKYRDLQNLQLTELQARVLEAITPEKIEAASLNELVSAFKTLKDKELVSLGKPNEITGLVGYLIQLEKDQLNAKQVENIYDAESVETVQEASKAIVNSDYLPKL